MFVPEAPGALLAEEVAVPLAPADLDDPAPVEDGRAPAGVARALAEALALLARAVAAEPNNPSIELRTSCPARADASDWREAIV